ncbi:MAG: hypothetical protein ACR2HM_10820 [Acidimicrobiales bacterium]
MSDTELEELLAEAERRRLGNRWLAEIRSACADVSRRFDPAVYAVAEQRWSDAEVDDLVQDVTVEQLLRQGQLDYILDVAQTINDVRRLLRRQVRRALVRRRRLTVVDRLLSRLAALLDGPGYERLVGLAPARYRPAGSSLSPEAPSDEVLRRAAAAVRLLPTTSAAEDRAPTVFRAEVLAAVATGSFRAAGTSLSIDDFGRILRDALTSWLPVVLELSEEFDLTSADPSEAAYELEQTVETMIQEFSDIDRLVLRSKLAGAPDSELASLLGVSRPTAAKRKQEAFFRLRQAWEAHAGDLPPGQSPELAQMIYLRLSQTGAEQ